MEVLEVGYGPTTRDFDYSFNFLNLQVDSQINGSVWLCKSSWIGLKVEMEVLEVWGVVGSQCGSFHPTSVLTFTTSSLTSTTSVWKYNFRLEIRKFHSEEIVEVRSFHLEVKIPFASVTSLWKRKLPFGSQYGSFGSFLFPNGSFVSRVEGSTHLPNNEVHPIFNTLALR